MGGGYFLFLVTGPKLLAISDLNLRKLDSAGVLVYCLLYNIINSSYEMNLFSLYKLLIDKKKFLGHP